MKVFLFIAVLAVVVVAALAILRKKGAAGDSGPWPFHARKPLSVPEQILYFRLLEALPEHIVLAQVGLSRILGVNKGNNFQAWHNRINRMSADFVVCKKDSTVVTEIELDDASHEASERKAADQKKDRALTAAGVPIIRWQAEVTAGRRNDCSAIGQSRPAQAARPVARAA